MQKTNRNKALSLLLTLAMIVSLCVGLGATAGAVSPAGYTSISTLGSGNSYTISAPGNYYLDASISEATVFVSLGESADRSVTIAGDGVDTADMRSTITIECAENTALTLENLYIKNSATGTSPTPGGEVAAGASVVRFTGAGNVLNISGTVLLETTTYVSSAGIAVNAGTDLTITGSEDSYFYMYKYSQGCGIGADANNANGTITINSGNILIKGSKTGAIIGNDTAGNAALEAKIGKITINGGNIALATMSQGAAIGGSRMSKAGDVAINGGSVFILSDFTGSAIGAGARMNGTAANNGTLTLGTAASLKVVRTGNSLGTTPAAAQHLNDSLVRDAIANTGTAKYQCAIPVSGSTVTVEEDTLLYSGANPTVFPFTESTSSTMANWGTPTNGYVYLYLTGEDHFVTVNDTDTYICTWDAETGIFEVTAV